MIDAFHENRIALVRQDRKQSVVSYPEFAVVAPSETREESERIPRGLLKFLHDSPRDRGVEAAQIPDGLVCPADRPSHPSEPQLPLDPGVNRHPALLDVQTSV